LVDKLFAGNGRRVMKNKKMEKIVIKGQKSELPGYRYK